MKLISMISGFELDKHLQSRSPFFSYQHIPLLNEFGINNVRFVKSSDVYQSALNGDKVKFFKMDSECKFYPSSQEEIHCDLFHEDGIDLDQNIFIEKSQLEILYSYLERLKNSGNIGELINGMSAALNEDKLNFIHFKSKGFPVIETHHICNSDSIHEFLLGEDREYILKPRFGYQGRNILLLENQNLTLLNKLNLSNYIIQPVHNVSSEKRLFFFNGNYQISRIIENRSVPWKQKTAKNDIISMYHPSKNEIDLSKLFFSQTNAILGCVDLVDLDDGTQKILEYNGSSTNLRGPNDEYNIYPDIYRKFKSLI